MRYAISGAFAALVLATPVMSADSLVQTGESVYDWSGFHVGIGGGRGAVVHELSTPFLGGINFDGIGGEGVFGQITAGYDHAFGNGVVIGAEVMGRYGNIGTSLDVSPFLFSADLEAEYGFDVTARLGYTLTPNTLGYVLGGYTWQRFELTSSIPGIAYNWDDGGYVLGVGMETAIRGKWTWKSEYRYSKYNSHDVLGAGVVDVDPSVHTFHTSINYRLNGGPSSRTMAPIDYSWTGFKVGAAVGAGALVHDVDVSVFGPFGASLDGIGAEGVFGDISVGYDHEFGNGFVGGVVLAARYSNIETELNIAPGSLNIEADYGFDAMLRVGKTFGGRTLAYVIGGYSWQHFDISTSPASIISYDWGANGWTIGTGTEVAFSDRITGYAEYRYSQYEDDGLNSGGFVSVEPSSHTVRIGAKYKLY